MLTKLADAGAVSAAGWLRGSIRAAFQNSPLETLPQRISRAGDAFAQEHRALLDRIGVRASKRLPPPEYPVLKQRLQELRALVKEFGKSVLNFEAYVVKYEGAMHRAATYGDEPPVVGEKDLQNAFDTVWMLLDDWKERSRAEEAARR